MPSGHSNASMAEDSEELACRVGLSIARDMGKVTGVGYDPSGVGCWASDITLPSDESDAEGSEGACSGASSPAALHPDRPGTGSGPGSGAPQHARRRGAAARAAGSASGIGSGQAPSRASRAARAAAAAAQQAAAQEDALEAAILAAHARCAAGDSDAECGPADLGAEGDAAAPSALKGSVAEADAGGRASAGAAQESGREAAGRRCAEGGHGTTGNAGWDPGAGAGPAWGYLYGPAGAQGPPPGAAGGWGNPCDWGAWAAAQAQASRGGPAGWSAPGAHAGQPQWDHAPGDPSWHAPGAGVSDARDSQNPSQAPEGGPWDPAWQAAGAGGPDSQGMVRVPGALLARYWRLEWEAWRGAMAAWTARYEAWVWHWQAAQWQAAQGGEAAHGEDAQPGTGEAARAE